MRSIAIFVIVFLVFSICAGRNPAAFEHGEQAKPHDRLLCARRRRAGNGGNSGRHLQQEPAGLSVVIRGWRGQSGVTYKSGSGKFPAPTHHPRATRPLRAAPTVPLQQEPGTIRLQARVSKLGNVGSNRRHGAFEFTHFAPRTMKQKPPSRRAIEGRVPSTRRIAVPATNRSTASGRGDTAGILGPSR